jgi:signal transduction histidine kinase/PAS domain-containing protein
MAGEQKRPVAQDAASWTSPQHSEQDAPQASSAVEEDGAHETLGPADARRKRVALTWRAALRWLRANSWLPKWFPARWRYWGMAYLFAVLLQAVAIGLTSLINGMFPAFPFPGALEFLVIVFVALAFGVGPSLLVTFLGAALIGYVTLSPRYAWSLSSEADILALGLFIIIGSLTSILASQAERARGMAEAARERAERLAAALASERARLEAVIEATPDRVAIFDERGRIERLNAAAQRVAGPERGAEGLPDYQQAYMLRRLSGGPLPTDELPLTRALRGETVADVEMLFRDSEGRDQSILTSAAPIRGANGEIQGAIAITHDITRLREAQQTAIEHASQLEAIFESMADSVFVYDPQGRIVRSSAAARKLFAFDARPDYATLPLDERLSQVEMRDPQGRGLPVEESPHWRVIHGETLAGGEATDYLLRVLDGREVVVNVTGAPVRLADGSMRGGILVLRDVTEQRRLERRTREALDAILEMARTLVTLPPGVQASQGDAPWDGQDIPRRIAYLTCRVLGCVRVSVTAVEPGTKLLRALTVVGLSPDQACQWWAEQREMERRGARLGDGADPVLLARFLGGEPIALDMTQPPYADLPNPYGVTISLVAPMRIGNEVVGMLSLDYGGPPHVFTPDEIKLASGVAQLGAVVLERDRLLRERAEAQASLLAAQETNQRMDEFLSVASHELKTPISTAHANLQIAERRLLRLDEELAGLDSSLGERVMPLLEPLRAIIQRADSATRRQTRLVNDLLDVTRLQSGKLDLQIEACDLAKLVRDCVVDIRLEWPKRAISAAITEESALVAADPDRITQVVTNFLTNALKYSPDDTPVKVALMCGAGGARVSVTDEGPGIPEDAQARLWERFYRAPDVEAQSGSGAGLGLGLYICHEIIKRHGGEIGVASQAGAGSEFWFTLPLTRG